jgi:hypothetical protein
MLGNLPNSQLTDLAELRLASDMESFAGSIQESVIQNTVVGHDGALPLDDTREQQPLSTFFIQSALFIPELTSLTGARTIFTARLM